MKKGKIREINFDLYSKKCPANAYKQIRKFMKENGFEHRLWSGYISKDKMTDVEVAEFNIKLWEKFSWLENGVRRLDVTNAENKFDLIELHKEQIEDEIEMNKKTKSTFQTMSLSELKSEVNKRENELNKQNDLDVYRKNDLSLHLIEER